VACGHWPLFRYNPSLAQQGKNPLQLDSKDPTISLTDYTMRENRYKVLQRMNPAASEAFMALSQKNVNSKFAMLKNLAAMQM
jgi:pyruvate-ferredoxin/flavodoxin oxidoreductase